MPSGAKKRKAAKKKKEQQTIISNNNNPPQGNNELKTIVEKGSDGGAPAAAASVAKPLEEVPNHSNKINEGVVVIAGDFKSKESSENNDVSSVDIDSAKESNYGNGNSGGLVHETVAANKSKDEPYNSVKETAALDEVASSVKETVNSVAESSADPVEVVKSVTETQNGDTENVLPTKSIASQVGVAVKKNEDKVHPFPDEDVRTSSSEEDKAKEFDNKVSSSESHSLVPRSTNGAEHVKDSDSTECSENQPLIASAPHMVQKTSWLSCCGLFEVLSGSNR